MKHIASGLVLGFLLLGPQDAESCSCVRVGEEVAEAMLKDHELVLLAAVTRVEKTAPPADKSDLPEAMWPLRVTFVPERIWKGHRLPEYITTTDAPWNTCGYSFVAGERYLIYSKDGHIPATQCDAIYRARDATKQIRALGRATHKRETTSK